MSNDGDEKYVQQLIRDIECWDNIIDHRTGSEGDLATDAWLLDELNKVGISGSVQTYECELLTDTVCCIVIQTPGGEERIEGVPLFDSLPSGPAGVSGTIGDNICALQTTPFDQHPSTAALHTARSDPQHQAIIAVAAATGIAPGLALLNAEHYRSPFGVPVVQISSHHNALIEDARRQRFPVQVLCDFSRSPGRATNVQASITGADPSTPPLVVMTPKSAWWTCTAERIGGVAIWLALARHFAVKGSQRSVFFTANSGHELSHLGLDAALQASPDLVAQAHLWLHLGANFAARHSQIRIQASNAAGLGSLEKVLSAAGVDIAIRGATVDRPLGEARNLYDRGGRFLSILGSNHLFHHPQDRWPTPLTSTHCTPSPLHSLS